MRDTGLVGSVVEQVVRVAPWAVLAVRSTPDTEGLAW